MCHICTVHCLHPFILVEEIMRLCAWEAECNSSLYLEASSRLLPRGKCLSEQSVWLRFQVNDTEGSIFLAARAQIIDELETTIPCGWRSDRWCPKYIYFLQARHSSLLTKQF